MLWGTRPSTSAAKADLDGDGRLEFGEVLPDANVVQGRGRRVRPLRRASSTARRRPGRRPPSDAFTSVVVMVPTMSEYFGQWKVSRFVLGDKAQGESFNVVSRLSDIGDILGGLRVIYRGHRPRDRAGRPAAGGADEARARRALDATSRSCGRRSGPGKRFTPQQADTLGRDGAGARDGDRGPGHAGGRPAQGEDRPVARCGASPARAVVGGEPRARRRRARRRRAVGGAPPTPRSALSDAEAEIVLGDPAGVRGAGRRRAPRRVERVLAGTAGGARRRARCARPRGGGARPRRRRAALAAARAARLDGDPRTPRSSEATRRGRARRRRRGARLAPRARVPPADAVHARRGGRDARARRASRAGVAHGRGGRRRGAPRPARHVRRPAPLDARRARTRRTGSGFDVERARRRARSLRGLLGASSARRTGRSAAPRAARATDDARRGARRGGAHGRGVARRARSVAPRAASRASAPLRSPRTETLRRAGQLDRFLRLVADRVRARRQRRARRRWTSRSRRRSRSATARRRRSPTSSRACSRRDRAATRRVKAALASLGDEPRGREPRWRRGRDPDAVEATRRRRARRSLGRSIPNEWKDAAKTADFDVIAATLDRMQARGRERRLGRRGVGAARGVRHLRARARAAAPRARAVALPGRRVALLVRRRRPRRARPADQAQGDRRRSSPQTRAALDDALADAEERIGHGPGSRVSIVTNSAIIVFREGLEAVLILAALMASMVGAQRRLPAAAARRRRPRARRERRHVGRRADRARLARALRGAARGDRLARRDRRAAPDPQLVLPPRLLAGAPRRASTGKKRRSSPGAGLSLVAAQVVGLVAARLHERLPRGVRDRALPPGADARGGRVDGAAGRRARLRRRSSPSSSSSSRSSGSSRTRRC